MNDSYDNIITICNTFGLEMDCIESCTSIVRNKQLVIDLKLTDKRPPCPECGNESVKIKGYVAKKINHSILNDKGCILVYHARRFICPICHTTYYEFNPFVFKKMKITSNVIQCVMRDLTKPSETFVSIAERYHISPTTVASIFDATVNIPRAKLPRIMSTDENYVFYSKDTHCKYVCVLIDQQTGRPIDILPSRRYDYLDEYYSKIPKYEKEYLPKYAVTLNQNKQIDNIYSKLDDSIVKIDLRNTLKKHKDEYLYYKTDHHWTSLASYYAYQDIAKAFNLETTKQSDYTIYPVTTNFEGTLANKTGSVKIKDEIDIYVPKDKCDYVITDESTSKKSRTIYHSDALETKDQYTVFMGGNKALFHINVDNNSKRHLLLIKDSYANSLIPFLIPQYASITVVDARYYFEDYTRLIKDDLITDVLFMNNANTFVQDTSLADMLEAN